MSKVLYIILISLFSLTVISCSNSDDGASTTSTTTDNDTTTTDSKMPIIIPVHNWSSQVVMAYVIGGIFESIGDRVAYTPSDSQAVYESIRLGDVTISHEVWQSAFGKSFDAARDKGGLLDWGDHEARTLEDMGFPNWVMDKGLCPGLPNWEALKSPACAKNFATPDSGGKGRWLEGPQSWHQDLMPQRLEALGLGDLWTVKFAGGADALWAELAAAEKEGRGTIIFNWTPNFTDAAGFTFIKFPPYYDGCRPVDGGDGKCGSPDGYLKKAVNAKFPETHPQAAAIFKKMSFTTSQIGTMAALVDTDKMAHADAAKKWLADNKNVWESWTTNSTTSDDSSDNSTSTSDNSTSTSDNSSSSVSGVFVAVGQSGNIVRSTDNGSSWDNATSPTANHLLGVTFGNNTFVGVGFNGNIVRSTDNGTTWDNATSPTAKLLYGVGLGNNTFVAVGDSGNIVRSTDNGTTWDNATSQTTNVLNGVTFGNNTFVAVGLSGNIIRSTDNGSSWDNATSPTANHLLGVTFGNNTFVGVGFNGNIVRSTDNGTTWDNATSPTAKLLYGVGLGNNTFVAVGDSGNIVRSTDNGTTWDNATSPTASNLFGVNFGNNTFVGVGNNGNIVRSTDNGSSWDNVTSSTGNWVWGVTFLQ